MVGSKGYERSFEESGIAAEYRAIIRPGIATIRGLPVTRGSSHAGRKNRLPATHFFSKRNVLILVSKTESSLSPPSANVEQVITNFVSRLPKK